MKSRDNHLYVGLTYILSVFVIKMALGIVLGDTLLKDRSLLYQANVVYALAAIPALLIGYALMRYSILNTVGESYKISFYWTLALIVLEIFSMLINESFTPLTALAFYAYLNVFYYTPILHSFIKRV